MDLDDALLLGILCNSTAASLVTSCRLGLKIKRGLLTLLALGKKRVGGRGGKAL